MKDVVRLSSGHRHELFQETAARRKIKPAIAEKDFWVCWTLARLFEESSISRSILLKGGTSLSKVFGLIDRFSEDIDLILDWRLLTEEDPEAERSRTQQDKFNLLILESSQNYIKNQLLPVIKDILDPNCSVEINPDYPDILNIAYPSSFHDKYLLPYIQLEIGPLSAAIPHDNYTIRPYAADEFPGLFRREAHGDISADAEFHLGGLDRSQEFLRLDACGPVARHHDNRNAETSRDATG